MDSSKFRTLLGTIAGAVAGGKASEGVGGKFVGAVSGLFASDLVNAASQLAGNRSAPEVSKRSALFGYAIGRAEMVAVSSVQSQHRTECEREGLSLPQLLQRHSDEVAYEFRMVLTMTQHQSGLSDETIETVVETFRKSFA
jgi:hypothetical protein